MTQRAFAFAAWIFTALATHALHDASAQDRSSLVSDVQTGFAGFNWGATLDEIKARQGTPAEDTVLSDYHRLIYRQSVDGRPVEIWYLFHPTRGLMSGQVNFEKPAEKCQDEFKRIREEVEHANPKLGKREVKSKSNFDAVCANGASPQFASWKLTWGDSGSARVAELMITGGPIILWYRGPGADAYAAELLAARGPAMAAFASFAWGVPRDSIVKRLGQPKGQDSAGGVVKLNYPELLLGERVVKEFSVAPLEGLMSGVYWVQVPAGQNCEVFFRKFFFALAERFEGIKAKAFRSQTYCGDFCEAIAKGNAFLFAVWKDPKSDASVSAELLRPGKYVKISYLGPQYTAWSKRTRTADLKDKL
jgi:hypothetical protein